MELDAVSYLEAHSSAALSLLEFAVCSLVRSTVRCETAECGTESSLMSAMEATHSPLCAGGVMFNFRYGSCN